MEISVSEAKAQLTELVRQAEAGEEIVLTRHGKAAARIVGIKSRLVDRSKRRAILDAVRKAGRAKAKPGPSAARSQDFLYGDDGMPI